MKDLLFLGCFCKLKMTINYKQGGNAMMSKKWFVSMSLCCCSFMIFSITGSAQESMQEYSPDLESQTISYIHTPKLKEYFRTYSPHGMTFQSGYVVANVMDENGQKYNLLRKWETAGTSMTMASVEVPGLKSSAKPIFKPGEMFQGRIYHELSEDKASIHIKPFTPGSNAFSIILKPQHAVWKDVNGTIDLTFKALGPALEYYVPGKIEDAMYRSEPCWVEGAVDGKGVSGFGVIDYAWGPIGVGFVQGKIYKHLEELWIVWANVFADGTKECGIFVDGVDHFEAYYYNKEGQAQVTRDNKIDLKFNEKGFVTGATVKMDDFKFEYINESRVLQSPVTLVAWGSGRVVNRAETRKPIKSFAWLEFFPKGKRSKMFSAEQR